MIIDYLRGVFSRFRKYNLNYNPTNVSSFERKWIINIWITEEGCRPGPTKVEVITDFRRPDNKKELERFRGMTG
jgi:hypothetical protein